jgi:predicted enzyme related to lactoylglutathione lyase
VAGDDGRFVWYELITTDKERAKAFYSMVLGWGTQDVSIPSAAYSLFTLGDTSVSGLMNLPTDADKIGAKPRWIGYVGVNDVDAYRCSHQSARRSHARPPDELRQL